jgi:hypothetical protein
MCVRNESNYLQMSNILPTACRALSTFKNCCHKTCVHHGPARVRTELLMRLNKDRYTNITYIQVDGEFIMRKLTQKKLLKYPVLAQNQTQTFELLSEYVHSSKAERDAYCPCSGSCAFSMANRNCRRPCCPAGSRSITVGKVREKANNHTLLLPWADFWKRHM